MYSFCVYFFTFSMLQEFALGIASLLGNESSSIFHEEVFEVPVGQAYVLQTDDFDWNAVTLFTKDGSDISEIEYLSADKQWVHWHEEHVGEGDESSILEVLHFPERTDSIVIKSPETLQLVGHFYNTIEDDEWFLASAFNPFNSDGAEKELELFSEKNNLPQPKFYARKDWGADERLRWSSVAKRLFTRRTSGLPSEIDDFPTRFKPKIIEDSYDGKPVSWPVAEMPQVYKMVVHHTGEYVDPKKEVRRDPRAVMRSIYYYHTITLGWGDIGYHYVIDKRGNIYEGRSGGPKAIGAHVAYHNAGSIGVSLMGNFEVEEPSNAQIHSLTLLLADHADRFNIDPLGRSYYLGKLSHNISGHRDVTAKGRGTACPGTKLHKKLPNIRDKVEDYIKIIQEGKRYKNTTRNILQKSKLASQGKTQRRFRRPERALPLTVQNRAKPQIIQRNGRGVLRLEVKNNTDFQWPKGVSMEATNVPEGVSIAKLKSTTSIKAGKSGIFEGKIIVRGTPNGAYALTVKPVFLKSKVNETTYKKLVFDYPLQVSGDRRLLTKDFRKDTTTKANVKKTFSLKSLQASTFRNTSPKKQISQRIVPRVFSEPTVRIKLAEFNAKYATVSADKEVQVFDGNRWVLTLPARKEARFLLDQEDGRSYVTLQYGSVSKRMKSALLQTEGILKIHNYDRGINRQVPFNSFRSDLRFYPEEQTLLVVNELPIEKYLYGLAEETGAEPEEKRKAILVLARSYAYVYTQPNRRKFKTDLYDLEDSPRTSQLYLGHDWERYHSTQKGLVDGTKGEILTHQGFPIIGPYFTQSSGHSSGAWKRQYPWAKVQALPYDKGLEAKGHGVGLSGNSARELAKKGKSYEQIIDYFFSSVEVEKKMK